MRIGVSRQPPATLLVSVALALSACGTGRASQQPSKSLQPTQTPAATPIASAAPLAGLILYSVSSQDGSSQIFTARPDGSHRRALVDGPACCFAVQADGQRVVFQEGPTSSPSMVNLDGSGLAKLTIPDRALRSEIYSLSPDGTHLAFHGWHEDGSLDAVFIARAADGGNLTEILSAGHRPTSFAPVAFSPDGSRLLVVGGRAVQQGQPDVGDVYVVNTDGTGLRQLNPGDLPARIEPGAGVGAAWSPDGAQVAFAGVGPSGKVAIYVVGVDGKGLRRITKEGASQGETWSPDGRWIAFSGVTSELAGIAQVFIVHPDGSGLRMVTRFPSGDCCPVWSPDSRYLLVGGLSIVSLDGATEARVTTETADTYAWVGVSAPAASAAAPSLAEPSGR